MRGPSAALVERRGGVAGGGRCGGGECARGVRPPAPGAPRAGTRRPPGGAPAAAAAARLWSEDSEGTYRPAAARRPARRRPGAAGRPPAPPWSRRWRRPRPRRPCPPPRAPPRGQQPGLHQQVLRKPSRQFCQEETYLHSSSGVGGGSGRWWGGREGTRRAPGGLIDSGRSRGPCLSPDLNPRARPCFTRRERSRTECWKSHSESTSPYRGRDRPPAGLTHHHHNLTGLFPPIPGPRAPPSPPRGVPSPSGEGEARALYRRRGATSRPHHHHHWPEAPSGLRRPARAPNPRRVRG